MFNVFLQFFFFEGREVEKNPPHGPGKKVKKPGQLECQVVSAGIAFFYNLFQRNVNYNINDWRVGHLRYFLNFSIIKNDFFSILSS